jgi:hypothetical protein
VRTMKKATARPKSKMVLFRLREPLYTKIKAMAEEDRRSVANIVMLAVEKYLEKAS